MKSGFWFVMVVLGTWVGYELGKQESHEKAKETPKESTVENSGAMT